MNLVEIIISSIIGAIVSTSVSMMIRRLLKHHHRKISFKTLLRNRLESLLRSYGIPYIDAFADPSDPESLVKYEGTLYLRNLFTALETALINLARDLIKARRIDDQVIWRLIEEKEKEGIIMICVNNQPVIGFRALRLMIRTRSISEEGDIEKWKKRLFTICYDILHDQGLIKAARRG